MFAQANFELALPDKLSDIVNTGIQQGGVENAVPIAIRESAMNKTLIFMNNESKTLVLDKYMLVSNNSIDYERYLKKYPVLENESIYVSTDLSSLDIDELNPIMGSAILVVSFFEQIMDDPEKADDLSIVLGFNISAIPSNMSLFTLLSQLPPGQLNPIIDTIEVELELSTTLSV
jgi:ATP-binding cassette subfamily B protein